MLILGGGLLFLFSTRQKNIIWIPLLSLWGLSALPFSATATAWEAGNHVSWLFIVPFLPAQALLMTGAIRHALHPGETSLESYERWTKFLYPTGLFLLAGIMLLLGIWGWNGAQRVGQGWAAIIAIVLTAGFTALVLTVMVRLAPSRPTSQWTRIFRMEWVYSTLESVYDFLCRIAEIITSSLEGEGGLLWSLLLLALLLSILSTQAH